MKFTSTTQDLGPLRTVTLPAAKWELVRRAVGCSGFDLTDIFDRVFTDASVGVDMCDLPTLGFREQADSRESAKAFLAERTETVEHDIEIGGVINSTWEVLAVGEDWATCRDTLDGEVALWFQGEVGAYTPPEAQEAPKASWPWPEGTRVRLTDSAYRAAGQTGTLGDDGSRLPPVYGEDGCFICYAEERDVVRL